MRIFSEAINKRRSPGVTFFAGLILILSSAAILSNIGKGAGLLSFPYDIFLKRKNSPSPWGGVTTLGKSLRNRGFLKSRIQLRYPIPLGWGVSFFFLYIVFGIYYINETKEVLLPMKVSILFFTGLSILWMFSVILYFRSPKVKEQFL